MMGKVLFQRRGKWTLCVALLSSVMYCGGGTPSPIACADIYCPPPSNDMAWAAQLAPSSSAATDPKNQLLAQEQTPLRFDGAGLARLQFRPTVLLSGSLLDGQATPLGGARVIARLESVLAGQNPYSLGTLTADSPGGAWTMRVPLAQQPSTQPYHLWVGFDDSARASLAPPLWQEEAISADTALALRLRPPSELAVVSGRIINALGEGVSNLTVQVLNSSGQIVSSTAVSEPAPGLGKGAYRLFVDPALTYAKDTLTVVVRPGPLVDSTTPILEANLEPQHSGGQTQVDFAVPSHRTPMAFQLPIRGGMPGSSALPIEGATVQALVMLEDASTIKLGNRAYYLATGKSDAQGIARLSLVPAPNGGSNLVYQVTIYSPSLQPFASLLQTPVQVGPNAGLLGAVLLQKRAELRGRLVSAQGMPVAGAEVVATPIANTETYSSPLNSMSIGADLSQITTDGAGRFALRLDAGDYDLEFVPISGTEARSSLDNLRISDADIELGDVHLPPLSLGTLQVLGPNGATVADTKVRIFELPDLSARPGIACTAELPCSKNAKLRGEAFTGSDGLAKILLPGGRPTGF